jgi:hypothetical protein
MEGRRSVALVSSTYQRAGAASPSKLSGILNFPEFIFIFRAALWTRERCMTEGA